MHGSGAEVGHELYLSERVARSGRNGEHANALGTILETESSGEHSVARRVLEHVVGAQSNHPEVASHLVSPFVEVFLRVEYHSRIACRSRRGMQSHTLLQRHRGKAEGIGVAQVLLCGEWNAAYVVNACYALRRYSSFLQPFFIHGIVHAVSNSCFQSLHLQCLNLLPRHCLQFGVEVF